MDHLVAGAGMTDQVSPSAESVSPGEAYAAAVGKVIRLHNLLIFVVFLVGLICLGITQARGGGADLPVWATNLLITVRIALPILALVLTAVYTSRGWDQAAASGAGPQAIFELYQRLRLLSMSLLAFAGVFAAVCLVVGNTRGDLLLLLLPFGLLILTRPSLAGFVYLVQGIRNSAAEDAEPGD